MINYKIIILFFISTIVVFSQINIRSVESFSVEDGLSQTSVHSIFQDSRGLLWLGTEGGINKYDGYSITPFHTIDSRKILSSRGTIFSIMEDHNSDLWYGSSGVLSRLNIHSEIPDNLNTVLEDAYDLDFGVVLSVFQDSKKNIWFGTFGQGFYKVSYDFKEIKNFKNDPDSTGDSSLDYVRHFYEDDEGMLWIATYKGLVKFDPSTEKIKNVFSDKSGYEHVVIYKIIPSKNTLLLLTGSSGILIYDKETGKVSEFDLNLNSVIKEYSLRNAILQEDGRLWVCAYGGGVFAIDLNTNNIQNLVDLVSVDYKSALKTTLSIFIDRTGIIWIGTQQNGLLKLIPGERKIKSISTNSNGYKNIENFFSTTVKKDRKGIIWFSSNSGLYKINDDTKKVQRLSISDEFSPFMMKIYNILFLENSAWLSFGSYLVKYDLLRDSYEKILIENNGNITELLALDENQIVIGTSFGNIYFYEILTGNTRKVSIESVKSTQNTVIDCYFDDTNKLWIGTNNGLFLIDLLNDSLFVTSVQLNLKIDYITSITGSGSDKLWFTTYGDGLFAYEKSTSKLEHFTHQDGLPDNILYGAMFDNQNKLWMSSNRGIFEFDPISKTVRTLDPGDGLQGYEYNSKAFSKSSDGEFFFGGINGFDYFFPHEIVINNIPPKILIDKVILYDSVVVNNITDNFGKLYEFGYNENSISFEFSALDFTNPLKNNYEYKLEGINTTWIKAGQKRYATFPNINPGEYRFIVRGTNSDQVLNQEGVTFSFRINPPFWATWWFRLILISTVLLIPYSIYKFRMINEDKRIKEIETIRKRIADDFHDDLGHKLTRISLYSEMIRNQEEFGTNKQLYLDKISDAANSLFYETKDFIWSIDPGNDTVYDVLVYLKDFGDDFFNRSTIAFKVDEIDEKFKLYKLPMKWKREIILIFKEVMNNVIKHSMGTTAELKAEVSNSVLNISIRDDGNGFDKEQNYYSSRGLTSIEKRAKVVEGQILINSDESGTTVKLSLNIPED